VRSEWDTIVGEYYDRKATIASAVDARAQPTEARAAIALTQVREWLVAHALPGSANPLFRLTMEDGIASSPPWLRIRFAMRDATVESPSGDSTLLFSVSDDVLISVPDLSPCFPPLVSRDELLPSAAELPDTIELSGLHAAWVVEAVQQFVRAALARQ
jgi:hypothetical protein